MILRWKNFDEVACALAGYLSIPWEEKYELMEENSRKARMEKIERAVYELIAVYQVGEEAETAQKDSNSQLYRESALKKRSSFCRNSLMKCIRKIFQMYAVLRRKLRNPV